MAYAIRHLLHINVPRARVYEALTTIDGLSGWWTNQTTGRATAGGVIQFRFGDAGCDMKVTRLVLNESVAWECIAGFPDWIGTTIIIRLDESGGKTRVRFEHSNWNEETDYFAACSFSWGRYLESLRQLCEKGRGEAFGSGNYRQ